MAASSNGIAVLCAFYILILIRTYDVQLTMLDQQPIIITFEMKSLWLLVHFYSDFQGSNFTKCS